MTDFDEILADSQAQHLRRANTKFDDAVRELRSARETPQPSLLDIAHNFKQAMRNLSALFAQAWREYGS
jgi:cell division protein ZapA (FtsZ GTPase activity inhibitor)